MGDPEKISEENEGEVMTSAMSWRPRGLRDVGGGYGERGKAHVHGPNICQANKQKEKKRKAHANRNKTEQKGKQKK